MNALRTREHAEDWQRKEHGDKHDTSDGERFRQSLRLEYQGAKDALSYAEGRFCAVFASGNGKALASPRLLNRHSMITIVSGLPRSGTSLMMQMLAAGGMSILSDGERQADLDNPRGYFEWERIKQLPKEPDCIVEAEGKVVKVISQLLLALPAGHDYRVIFMQRPLAEVLASQDQMLHRRGTFDPRVDTSTLVKGFQNHLYEVNTWLNNRPNLKVMRLHYHHVLSGPKEIAEKLAQFLEFPLDLEATVRQVDGKLYRQRAK